MECAAGVGDVDEQGVVGPGEERVVPEARAHGGPDCRLAGALLGAGAAHVDEARRGSGVGVPGHREDQEGRHHGGDDPRAAPRHAGRRITGRSGRCSRG